MDGANCNTINGWVANLNNPTQPVSVDLYVDGQKITTLLPNQERGDVANAFRLPASVLNTNKFGYVWNLPDYLKTGKALTINARQAGTSIELSGSPRQTQTCPASTKPVDTSVTVVTPVVVAPVTPPAGARFDGWLDGANCNTINGWVANLNNPTQPVSVDLYVDGQKITTLLPNQERGDVANAFRLPASVLNTNKFGYVWNLPDYLKTGKALTINARQAGTSIELSGSPRQTQTCPASTKPVDTSVTVVTPVVVAPVTPPAGARLDGWMDGADCNTINGWAANLNNPSQAVSVDIYLNGQKVATLAPNDERRDVATAYNLPASTLNTNRFGYRWSLPAQYKTGRPITVSVRHAGTNTELAGSPRQTPTCATGGRINAQPNEVQTDEAPLQVVVYPNPASTELTVQNLPAALTSYQFWWVNLLGQQTELVPLPTSEETTARLNISQSPPGLYILRMMQEGKPPITVPVLKY